MSDPKNPEKPDTDETIAEDQERLPDPVESSAQKDTVVSNQSASSGGRFLSLFTLIVALLALALATQPYWPWQSPGFLAQQGGDSALNEVQADLRQLEQAQASIRRDLQTQLETQALSLLALEDGNNQNVGDQKAELKALETRVLTQLNAETDQLQTRLAQLEGEQNSQQGAMTARLEALEERAQRQIEQLALRVDSVGESLQNTDRSLAERLTLIQVDALLALGQDKLELDHDLSAAMMAWQRASSRLQSLESSVFNPLRESVQREQTMLEEYGVREAGQTEAQRFNDLNRLADEVSAWPQLTSVPPAEAGSDHDSNNEAGWGARVGQAIGSLVRIENVELAAPSALQIEQAKTRIQQSLQTAALAGARADWSLSQALIEAAQADIRSVFDLDDRSVQTGLEQLEMLKTEPQMAQLPELTASRAQVLRLLEQSQ